MDCNPPEIDIYTISLATPAGSLLLHENQSADFDQDTLDELAVLFTTATPQSVASIFLKAHVILAESSESLYPKYIARIFALLAAADLEGTDSLAALALARAELQFIFLDEKSYPHLVSAFELFLPSLSVIDSLKLEFPTQFFTDSVLEKVKPGYIDLSRLISGAVKALETSHLSRFGSALVDILPARLPLHIKARFLSYFKDKKDSSADLIARKLASEMLEVSMSGLVTNPAGVTLPFLKSILAEKRDDAANTFIAEILTETLVPGAADPAHKNSAFLATDLSETAAMGSPLRGLFAALGAPLDWPTILRTVAKNANAALAKTKDLSVSATSLNQFLFALPSEEAIDAFLRVAHSPPLGTALFFLLHEFETEPRAFQFNNMVLVFAEAQLAPGYGVALAGSIMRFMAVTGLFVDVVLSAGQDMPPKMTEVFNNDVKNHTECVVFALLAQERSTPGKELLQNLLKAWLQDMLPFLPPALQKLAERSLPELLTFLRRSATSPLVDELAALLVRMGLMEGILSLQDDAFDTWLVYAFRAMARGWKGLVTCAATYLEAHPDTRDQCFLQLLMALLLEAKHEADYGLAGVYDPAHSLAGLVAVFEILLFIHSYKHKKPSHMPEIQAAQKQCLLTYPRLINLGCGHDEAILANVTAGGAPNAFPVAVELEMKNHYQRMYSGTLEISDVVRMLQGLKELNVPYQQDVFACMVNSLLDEYRFFKEYPVDALQKTLILFGQLINYRLIEGVTLDLAFSYILDSARESPELNMFKFAVQALLAAKPRLPEFPKYCAALHEIPGLRLQPKVYEAIEAVAAAEKAAAEAAAAARDEIERSLFRSIRPPPKDGSIQESPSDEVSQRVLFVVNNSTRENLSERIGALKAALQERYFDWFAQYVVALRARVELNYQPLYADMVASLGSPLLEMHVLRVTYAQIARILNAGNEGATERGHLKNLGSWLGRITLARDRPILRDYLAVTDLLVEGYGHDHMALTIPFVCKVLDQASNSEVFRPPNPWTLSVVSVLVELYRTGLPLQLSFEIEVLLNSLGLKEKDIEVTTPVLTAPKAQLVEQIRTRARAIPEVVVATVEEPPRRPAPRVAAAPPEIPVATTDALSAILETFVALLGGTTFAQLHPSVRSLFLLAFAKAIREVIPAAVDRAANILVNTAHTLVLKDFALEGDETKLRAAAASLVRGIASLLGAVFLRDLILGKVYENVLAALQAGGGQDPEPLKQMVLQVANDNLEGACAVIEAVATEKACADMEESLRTALFARRQHARENPGAPFVLPGILRWLVAYPPPLGLVTGGVSAEQMKVYENFGGARRAPEYAARVEEPEGTLSRLVIVLQQLLETLLKALEESLPLHLTDLPMDHPVKVVLLKILAICLESLAASGDEIYVKVAQFTVNALFTLAESAIACETLVFLLNKLCILLPLTAKDASWWLVYAEDDRKYNARIMGVLLRVGMIEASDLDAALAKAVKEGTSSVAPFAAELIQETVLGPEPFCLRADFAATLAALAELSDDVDERVKRVLTSLHNNVPATGILKSSQMGYVFAEWVRLVQRLTADDRLSQAFVYQMAQRGILETPDNMALFFRTATEAVIASFSAGGAPYSTDDIFIGADALARLIVACLCAQADKGGQRVAFLKQVLAVITLVLTNDHENTLDSFNERPYYRVFSTLLCEWLDARKRLLQVEDASEKASFEETDNGFFDAVCDTLGVLQPLSFPGFSFAWVTLLAHRMFLPPVLKNRSVWKKLSALFATALSFIGARSEGKHVSEMRGVVQLGLVRIFQAILNDYPEFLIGHCYPILPSIPAQYLQLRNVTQSAIPKNTVLPDPYAVSTKIKDLDTPLEAPETCVSPGNDLFKSGIKKAVDNYLRIPGHLSLKTVLGGLKLSNPVEEGGIGFELTSVDVKLIHGLVLYIIINAVEELKDAPGGEFNSKLAHVLLLAAVLQDESVELQYHVLSAMVSQLRYLNPHTVWIGSVITYFFNASLVFGAKLSVLQQLITRVLLERLVLHRPHPWGIVVVFLELLREEEYGFSDLPFTKEIPELERVFSVLQRHIIKA